MDGTTVMNWVIGFVVGAAVIGVIWIATSGGMYPVVEINGVRFLCDKEVIFIDGNREWRKAIYTYYMVSPDPVDLKEFQAAAFKTGEQEWAKSQKSLSEK